MVQQQAITLHRFSLSLWWWTHLLRPSQEEIAPLRLRCLDPNKHTELIIKHAWFTDAEVLLRPLNYRMKQRGKHAVWYATSSFAGIGWQWVSGVINEMCYSDLRGALKASCSFFWTTKSQLPVSFLTGFMRISVTKGRWGSGTLWATLNSFLTLLSQSFNKISVKYIFILTVVTSRF